MSDTTLDQVQRLVDQLTPFDQVRLLEYLTPRIARVVASVQHIAPTSSLTGADTWKEFFRIGDTLAGGDRPGMETLTSAVLARR